MKLTHGGKLERPNVCFLCETTPPIGMKVIDTERYFDGHPYTLQGRRYVCERCINSMVPFFSLVDIATVERAETAANHDRMILRGLKLRIDTLFNDLRQIAESPNLLLDGLSGSVREKSQSIVVGDGEDSAPDAGTTDDSAGEGEVAGSAEPSAEGGHPEAIDDEPELVVASGSRKK